MLGIRCKAYLYPTRGFSRRGEVVDKLQKKGEIIYACELCGFGYRTLETAEQCEEHCGTYGSYSPEIHKQAISKPTVRIIPSMA